MTAYEMVSFELLGHRVEKLVRVADSVHPDGTPYTKQEYADALVREMRRVAVEAARDLTFELYGTVGRL